MGARGRPGPLKPVALWLSCLAVFCAWTSLDVWPTQADQEVAILRSVALDLAIDLPEHGVRVERRTLCSSGEDCASGRWSGERGQHADAAVRSVLRAAPGLHDSVVVCMPRQPDSCSLRGASALVALTKPNVEGDSAIVGASVWLPGRSAHVRTLARDLEYVLEKRAGTWTVRARRVIRST